MAQQTAMQQLIQWMKDNGNVIPFDQGDCYNEAIELLQMEKEQMLGFHKWMKENDTADNAEKYFRYSDEDMLNEYYKK